MNFGKIYSDATGRNDKLTGEKTNPAFKPTGLKEALNPDGTVPEESGEEKALDETAARRQLTQQWLDSTLTQEFLQGLNKQYNELIDKAMNFANSPAPYSNAENIVTILIRANELKKVINNKPA